MIRRALADVAAAVALLLLAWGLVWLAGIAQLIAEAPQ